MSVERVPRRVLSWAAAECARQPECGPLDVPRMVDAWVYAYERHTRLVTVDDILELARLVDPVKNTGGFRQTAAVLPSGPAPGWTVLTDAVARMIENQPLEPSEPLGLNAGVSVLVAISWYQSFEKLHPLRNGNGRVGAILYNWLKKTLLQPVAPPDLWVSE